MPLIYSPKYFTQASKKYLVNMPNRLPSKYFVQSTFKCFIFLLIAISFTKNTFAQNPKTEICNNLSISFNKNIQNQNYTEAAKIWDQREKAKCTFTEIDYYNAACIYSTKNEQALALKYLRLSINNDYEDTAHMAIDKDLNNIRNADGYKKLILLIQNKKIQKAKEEALQEKNRKINDWKNQFDNKQKQKWQFLKQYFVKIDLKKLKELIPYYLGDYWGYMNKSGVALTKPIFQFTDFYSMHGLLFKYQNEYFFYTNNGNIDKLKANTEDPEYSMRMDDKYNIALYDKPGFTMEDGIITGRCKEYTSLEILPTKSEAYISYKELFGTKTWAIVTKYDNHIAIIDSTGNPLNNIFNFSNQLGQSENFWSSVIAIENRVFYKLKNENQKENSTK